MSTASEVSFIVENQDFKIRGDILVKTSTYYAELLETSKDYSELRLILPDWISIKPFQAYLHYLENQRLPKINLIIAQKLLWLADFFKDLTLQQSLISQHIIPYLKKETVLLFVQDACTKIYSPEEPLKCWHELYYASCEFSANNLRYLYEKFPIVLDKLDSKALKTIFLMGLNTIDSDFIIEKIKEKKQVESYIDLLNALEKENLEAFNQDVSRKLVVEWNIEDFEFNNFYKETEVFKIASTEWVLCLWCFEHENRLEISIKQSGISKETKYNISVLTSIVQVQDEILETLDPHIFPIPEHTQNQCIIREITSLDLENLKNFSIKVYAHIDDIASNLLQKIVSKPEVLLTYDSENFPYSHLNAILDLKQLNVNCEDTALEILANWLQLNNCSLSEYEIKALSTSIRWEYTTIKGLITIICNYPKLKSYPIFQNLIRNEIENRGKALGKETHHPRKSYKKYVAREKYSNPKECLNAVVESVFTYNAIDKEGNRIKNLKDALNNAQKEISMLKSLKKDILSPIPYSKVEEDMSLNLTPVINENHFTDGNQKSRVTTMDTANKCTILTTRLKSRRTGSALNELISKIRNGRRNCSDYSSSKKN